jgi:hypothetical protein
VFCKQTYRLGDVARPDVIDGRRFHTPGPTPRSGAAMAAAKEVYVDPISGRFAVFQS